ncbi:MAG: zinc-binding dehydrogenase, partial [Dehalococcoidia bacterium]|nr:zinc-binding dehydrogenase [Dehalococcoidia bacterium]
IGLSVIAVAVSSYAEVGLSARYRHQVEAGNLMGAEEIDGLYDLVVECTGTDNSVNQAVELCRPNGKILLLGTYWEGISFPQLSAMLKEITIVNSYTYAAPVSERDFDIAAAILARNPRIASALITHRFPLVEVNQAFMVARDRKAGAIKVVLEP